ncbi:hypothetical protein PIROE2DRAFT_4226 [Piromyces sp. E2]|nr:hypothetical protein PIROE2DRAFT_4226 [Piromyces sp. E2]|eukprot:OUM68214.1 hypothetical protein PIROE2DRAFT_4226 [Piromyces sp. E2]
MKGNKAGFSYENYWIIHFSKAQKQHNKKKNYCGILGESLAGATPINYCFYFIGIGHIGIHYKS